MSSNRIVIGKSGARNVHVDIDILLRTRLLLQANSGGGKSWLLRRIAEQLYGKVPVHIIDPEGEFSTLREKFGFVLIGEGGEAAADIRSAGLVAQRLLELRCPAVIDLYESFRSKPADRRTWVRKYLEALVDAPKSLWQPLVVIVDEAHKFVPQETPKAGSQSERENINGCKEAMIALSTVGRKRRFCAVWATQRLAKVDKDASAELLNRLIGPTFEDVDIDRAADMLSVSRDERAEFKKNIRVLEPGNFYAIGRAITKEKVLVNIGEVETTHPDVDSTQYAVSAPPAPDKIKHLLPKLADLPKEAEDKARTESELRKQIDQLERELLNKQALRVETKTVEVKVPIEKFVKVPTIPKDLFRHVKTLMRLAEQLTGAGHDIGEYMAGVEIDAKHVEPTVSVTAADRVVRSFVENRAMDMIKTPSPIAKAIRERVVSPSNGSVDLPYGELRVLTAIVQFREVDRPLIVTTTGYKRNSVTSYLKRLSVRGLIVNQDGTVKPTDAADAMLLGKLEPLPIGSKLYEFWSGRLPDGERKILEFLWQQGKGMAIGKPAIADATGYAPNSVTSYIKRMSTKRIVDTSAKGWVTVSEMLFD